MSQKPENHRATAVHYSGFVIHSSFAVRISSFFFTRQFPHSFWQATLGSRRDLRVAFFHAQGIRHTRRQ
jgi:hypothetical protein